MAEQTELHVTEGDLQSLADKLEAFSQGLSPTERAALAALIRLATAAASAIAPRRNRFTRGVLPRRPEPPPRRRGSRS